MLLYIYIHQHTYKYTQSEEVTRSTESTYELQNNSTHSSTTHISLYIHYITDRLYVLSSLLLYIYIYIIYIIFIIYIYI